MKERIAEFLLKFNYHDECEEPDLVRDVIKMWTDPAHEQPKLIGLYFPGKGSPTMAQAALRGNLRLMQALMDTDWKHNFNDFYYAVLFGKVEHLELLIACQIRRYRKIPDNWHLNDDHLCSRLNRKMVDYLCLYGLMDESVINLLTLGDLRWVKILIDKGKSLEERDLGFVCSSAVNKGKVDILEWLTERKIMTSQEIMTKVFEYCAGFECCSTEGLNWLVDNGAVWSAHQFHHVFKQVRRIIVTVEGFDDYESSDLQPSRSLTLLSDLSAKEQRLWIDKKFRYHLTRGTNDQSCLELALQWMYEGGCPIDEEQCINTDPELWHALVTHLRRP